MRIYRDVNVFDAALARIDWLFSEFGRNVVVAFSGGKDSTVVLNLCYRVAEQRGVLPLKVMWIDQEAEWQAVVDYQRDVMHRPGIEPWWFQMPMRISNSTSEDTPWLNCWHEGEEWMRDREPDSIHENTFGTDRFGKLFDAIIGHRFHGQKACIIGGLRGEESPTRQVSMTTAAKYRGITWAKRLKGGAEQFTFYPIYDWSWRDVWVAIHRNAWPYCAVYDRMYQHGVPVNDMRVSNLHHETATSHLHYLQEFEPDTWAAITRRLRGTNAVKHLGENFANVELPPMFEQSEQGWRDYRDHLLANLITDPAKQQALRAVFAKYDARYATMHDHRSMLRTMVNTVLVGDHFGTKMTNWANHPEIVAWRQFQNGKRNPKQLTNPHIYGEQARKGRRRKPAGGGVPRQTGA